MLRARDKGLLSIAVLATVLSVAPAAWALLQQGDRGPEVRQLQEALDIPVDGIYGPQTAAAVREFQRQVGLSSDGVAGSRTLEALGLPGDLTASGDEFITSRPGGGASFECGDRRDRRALGTYVVAIPGDDADLLAEVRQFVSSACLADSRRGPFINAGGYADRDQARERTEYLRDQGFDARVETRP